MTRTKSSRALLSVVLAVLMVAAFMPALTYSSFAATAKKATKVTKLTHTGAKVYGKVGNKYVLKYKLSPSKLTSAAKKTVWKSSDSSIVKVYSTKSNRAAVKAKAEGTAKVTVYTKANKKAKTTWTFKVTKKAETKKTLTGVTVSAPNTSNDPAKLVTPETVLKANVDPATSDVTYQWYADGTAIAGATDQTFKVTGAQTGKAITVKASSKNEVTSAATAKVTEMTLKGHNDNPANSGVVVTNTSRKVTAGANGRVDAYVGDTLKATAYATYKDGTVDRTQETTDVTYQWYRVAQNASGDSMAAKDAIAGATSAEYKVTDADANYKLIVVATPNSTLKGSPVFSNSAFVSAVTAGTLTVKASATNGQVEATVKDAKGNDITGNYTYQWAQGIDGKSFTAIKGATGHTFDNAKKGFYYQVTVKPASDKYTVDKTTASILYNGASSAVTGKITALNDGSNRLFVSDVKGVSGTNYTVTWYKTDSDKNTNPVLATNLGTSQYYTVTAADKGSYIFAVIKSTGSDAAEGITASVPASVSTQTSYTLTYKDGKFTLDGKTSFGLWRYDTQRAQTNMNEKAEPVAKPATTFDDVSAAEAQGYTYFAVIGGKVVSNGLSFTDNAGTNTSVTVPTFLISNTVFK